MLHEHIHPLLRPARRDDRNAQSATPAALPPVLRRATLRFLAILGIVAVVYGSLAPFRIDPAKTWCWRLAWHAPLASDVVANLIIYVPIGILARLVLRRRESSAASECVEALAVAAGLSYGAEVTQNILIARVASWTDVAVNTAGAIAGIALAPCTQQLLRNHHAQLYHLLRRRPLAAAALTAAVAIGFVALTPFDLQPTPQHFVRTIQYLGTSAHPLAWPAEFQGSHALDKLMSAGAYGALALLLVLAAVEAGEPPYAAGRYALRRSLTLVTGLELLQLLTISHEGSVGDLMLGYICCVQGAAAGYFACVAAPQLVRHPRIVLRRLVLGASLVAVGRAMLSLGRPGGSVERTMSAWLPLAVSFHRPWSSLLAAYFKTACQYALIAALVALYCHSTQRRPRATLVIGAALFAAVASSFTTAHWDTAELLLALLASWLVLRISKALFPDRAGSSAAIASR